MRMALIPQAERVAAKSRVNMTLDADVVRRARRLTGNLSDTVETLLAGFVAREEARVAAEAQNSAFTASAFAAVDARHGSLSDDFPAF
jgi:antitoxin CcdA